MPTIHRPEDILAKNVTKEVTLVRHWTDHIHQGEILNVLRWVIDHPDLTARDCHAHFASVGAGRVTLDQISNALTKLQRTGFIKPTFSAVSF